MQGSYNLPPPINSNTDQPSGLPSIKGRSNKANRNTPPWVWLGIVGFAVLVLVGALFTWYSLSLRPVDESTQASEKRIIVRQGDGVSTIAQNLKTAELIRSPLAFRIYSEASGLKSALQAGGYVINSAQSTQEIINHMSRGITDEFEVTVIPGKNTVEIGEALIADGFAARDVESALSANYEHSILADKPSSASLEGYVFPETYRVMADSQAKDVIIRALDEFERIIDEGGYRTKLAAKGLNMHEAITLASIIQLEVPEPEEQRQVAQVFLKRLDEDMPLGSDPTFRYAAWLDGVEPKVDYDSPYNTRLYKGLPPGPIANFNLSALDALINPTDTDYLYFVSGDDGRTHFSRTLEQHEIYTQRYCTDLCR